MRPYHKACNSSNIELIEVVKTKNRRIPAYICHRCQRVLEDHEVEGRDLIRFPNTVVNVRLTSEHCGENAELFKEALRRN